MADCDDRSDRRPSFPLETGDQAMRSFALIVGLSALTVGSHCSAMSNPNEIVIALGKIVNVDEKNSSFDVLSADGRRTHVAKPLPVLMVLADQQDFSVTRYLLTWDDLRKISVSGRITSVAVDPSDPSVIYFQTWWA